MRLLEKKLTSKKIRIPSLWRPLTAMFLGTFFGRLGRIFLYKRLCGYDIAKSADIGFSFIRIAQAEIGSGSKIGHLTVIRNLEKLVLEPDVVIGTFNWIFGMLPSTEYFTAEPQRQSILIMRKGSALTSRHIVDCTATVTIGAYATVAGYGSQIITHGIDIKTNRQSSGAVLIGDYAMIGTRVIVLKNARIPDRSVVGAGSTFMGAPESSGGLWSGVPAKRVREIDENVEYFNRTHSRVK